MSKITVMIGISGSGKSTFSAPLLKNANTVRINRDDTRLMLFGAKQSEQIYYERKDIRACEDLVTETLEDTIYNALNKGRDIVLDNTNLQKKNIDDVLFKFNHLADIELVFLDIDLAEAKRRVQARNGSETNVTYIDKQFSDFAKLKKSMHGQQLFYPQTAPQVKFDENLPATYIFDIDGNLSLKYEGRNIFDDTLLHLDHEIVPVGNTLRALYSAGFKVIFLSGRQNSCYEQTKKWLEDKKLWMPDSEMFMRNTKDQRCDSIVKEELLLNNVVGKYNVIGIFDDRTRVVRAWNKLGIFCFNTNQNLIHF